MCVYIYIYTHTYIYIYIGKHWLEQADKPYFERWMLWIDRLLFVIDGYML